MSIVNDMGLFDSYPTFFEGPNIDADSNDPSCIQYRDVVSFRLESYFGMQLGTFYESYKEWPQTVKNHIAETDRLRWYRQNRMRTSEDSINFGACIYIM